MVPRLSVVTVLAAAIGLGAVVGAAAFLIVRPTAVGMAVPSAAVVPSSVSPGRGEPAPRVGSPAPELGLAALDGTTVSLESLRGRVVLVNFWASWCGPCEKEMADLQRLYVEERERGFVVVGVNEGEEPGRAAGFLARFGVTFPNVIDVDRAVTRRYQVFGLPNSYFIDGDGVVRARIVGPFTVEQMRGYLEQARRKQDVPPPLVRSVSASTIGEAERPVARVDGEVVTLGQVNRRLDLEQAFAAVRGSVPPDLTATDNRPQLQDLQRIVAERLVEERLIIGRAAADGIRISEQEIDSEVARVADEVQLDAERLAGELAARGSDISELRAAHHAAMVIGQFVAERVLTGQTPEKLDDYDAWLAAARQNSNVEVLPFD